MSRWDRKILGTSTSDLETRAAFTERAEAMLAMRRYRCRIFGDVLSKEVGWDLLLVLYAAPQRLTTTQLIALAGGAGTTGLRWLDLLEARGLIERYAHFADQRVRLISLSPKGEQLLNTYFAETSQVAA